MHFVNLINKNDLLLNKYYDRSSLVFEDHDEFHFCINIHKIILKIVLHSKYD